MESMEALNKMNFSSDLFRPAELSDGPRLLSMVAGSKEQSCELCFANLYNWAPSCGNLIQFWHDRLYVYNTEFDEMAFTVDRTKEDEPSAEELAEVAAAMKAKGSKGCFFQVRQETVDRVPGLEKYFRIESGPDAIDEYIYRQRSLMELRGKILSKKRNLIAQFERENPDAVAETVTEKNLEECIALSEEWLDSYPAGRTEDLLHEFEAIRRMRESFSAAKMTGVLIRTRGKAVAYAVAAPITEELWDEPFEKALYGYKGAAQFVNHELAKHLDGKCIFLNREQDLGEEGLRHAKMSYQPEYLLKNYKLTLRSGKE